MDGMPQLMGKAKVVRSVDEVKEVIKELDSDDEEQGGP